MTAFQSGMLTFASCVGAMVMKSQVATILRRYGFRRVLVATPPYRSLFAVAAVALHDRDAGVSDRGAVSGRRPVASLQFTSLNTLAYADVPPEKLSRATASPRFARPYPDRSASRSRPSASSHAKSVGRQCHRGQSFPAGLHPDRCDFSVVDINVQAFDDDGRRLAAADGRHESRRTRQGRRTPQRRDALSRSRTTGIA